jgi:hypothetical protein
LKVIYYPILLKKVKMSKQNVKSSEQRPASTGGIFRNVRQDVVVNANGVLLSDTFRITSVVVPTCTSSMRTQDNDVGSK